MTEITSLVKLKESILLLEMKQSEDLSLLKEEFHTTYESMKPLNIIKKKLHELASEPDLKGKIINTAMGLTAGYLTKKATVGSTHNPLKQLLGTAIQIGVSSLVSKNADGIKSVASNLISHLFNKKNKTAK